MASQEVLTALETLHREIEKLEPAIKHIETAQQVTQTVKAIPQKHVELLQEVKNNDAKHKDELKNLFAKELSSFTEENKKLQKATTEIQQQIRLELEALAKLKETVQSFHERVDKINFPERLDKLDTTISSVNQGIQNIQTRLGDLERNLKDDLHSRTSELSNKIRMLDSSISQISRDTKENYENQAFAIKKIWVVTLSAMFINIALLAGIIFILKSQ